MATDYTDLINAYLYGKMSVQEQTAFEEQVKLDPQLAKELALEKAVKLFGKELLKPELEQSIAQILAQELPKKPEPGRIFWIGSMLAAAAIALFVILRLDFFEKKEPLLAYVPSLMEVKMATKSGDSSKENIDPKIEAFNKAFSDEDWAKCKVILSTLPPGPNFEDTLKQSVKFAWLDFLEGNTSKAEQQFVQLQAKLSRATNQNFSLLEDVQYGLYAIRKLQGREDSTLRQELINSARYRNYILKLDRNSPE